VTVCRLHTIQRAECALVSDVCSATHRRRCIGEVEIEWRSERRSYLMISGHYSCKYQEWECISCQNLIRMERKAGACGLGPINLKFLTVLLP
jgi:hypothetical protein